MRDDFKVDRTLDIRGLGSPAGYYLAASGVGTIGVLGTLQAAEAGEAILGIGEPLRGRLLSRNALEMSFVTVKVPRNPGCPVCGDRPTITGLVDGGESCGAGEAERAAVARAIVNRPPLLLADEPAGNLYSRTGHRVMELLKDLSRDGVTVVMVAAAGLAWSLSVPEAVGLSKLKANPERYVGRVKVAALAGRTDPKQGRLEIVDGKACCSIVLEVPFTAEQQTRQKSELLYAGVLPEKGAALEILGTLRQVGAGSSFRVIRVNSGGKEIIKRV